jgi:hypothetical protein
MAVTLTLLAVEKGDGPYEEVVALAELTGNYTAGGDTLNFTQLYGQVDPAGRSIDSDQLPVDIEVESCAAIAGNNPTNYKGCMYTNPDNGAAPVALTPATCLLQAFSGITEETTGAYGNAYLSDYVIVKATLKGQQ